MNKLSALGMVDGDTQEQCDADRWRRGGLFQSSLEIAWASCASTDITKTAPPGKHRNRAYVGSLRTRALSPEISQIEKDDPSVRVIVT